jgi:D-glycero-D-manno-heptose 1,7-bisphosphate phosphatase
MRPAVFFDRDGVLNVDDGYVFEPSKINWINGAADAISAVNRAGYFAFVVTNQSGLARGLYEERHVRALHSWMSGELGKFGAVIDAFEYCPHHPEGMVADYRRTCECRKPKPGMINSLVRRYSVDITTSFLIGDKQSDMAAAAAAGLSGHLFSGPNVADFVIELLANRADP